ncbi:hypothetical protein GCM10020254_82430 [Streptomyces goshikiensis]
MRTQEEFPDRWLTPQAAGSFGVQSPQALPPGRGGTVPVLGRRPLPGRAPPDSGGGPDQEGDTDRTEQIRYGGKEELEGAGHGFPLHGPAGCVRGASAV